MQSVVTTWSQGARCRQPRRANPHVGDTALVAFGSALAGSVTGGAATAYGAFLVGRSDRRHVAWVRLHQDLLPALRSASQQVLGSAPYAGTPPSGPTKIEVIDQVLRTAIAGGTECYKQAVGVFVALNRRYRPEDQATDRYKTDAQGNRQLDRDEQEKALDKALLEFDAWLGQRLAGERAAGWFRRLIGGGFLIGRRRTRVPRSVGP